MPLPTDPPKGGLRRSPLRRLGMMFVPAVALIGLTELALRMADWPKKDSGREFVHNEVYWKEPASLHLEPISHKETGGTFRVSTDANGLRVPLHAEDKPAGTFRIMTLGCSTTFGWGVDDADSYPAQLETKLHERGRSSVEVVNGGQPGHSSFQGLWLWDTVLQRYHPDLVVFGYIVQDARKVAYSDRSQAVLQGNAEFLKQNVLYQSRLYLGLKVALGGWQIEQKDKAATVFRVPPDEYVENIRAFQKKVEAAGARFVLFGFPLERAGYTADHRNILHTYSDLEKVPLYDPQPEFERYSSQRTLYFPQDRGHANADGNALIATGMADWLETSALLPTTNGATGP